MKKEKCTPGMHKHKSCLMLTVGILILINAQFNLIGWAMFVGGVFVLAGIKGLMCKKK